VVSTCLACARSRIQSLVWHKKGEAFYGMVYAYNLNPALRRLKQEDRQFEASPGYLVSSRSAWAT
jgi:hypothetical protein